MRSLIKFFESVSEVSGGGAPQARGFTGHEHIRQFNIINMNARLYDPRIGRFLSPDNYITDPENPQNYNRYTYALNNPLSYVDPTGNDVLRPDRLSGFGGGSAVNFSMGGLSLGLLSGLQMSLPMGYTIDICVLEYYLENGAFYTFSKYLLSPSSWGREGESFRYIAKSEIIIAAATDKSLGKIWSTLQPSTKYTILNALYAYYNDVSDKLKNEKCVYEVIGEVRRAILKDGTKIEGVAIAKGREQNISEVWEKGVVDCKDVTPWEEYTTFPESIFDYEIALEFHFHPPDFILQSANEFIDERIARSYDRYFTAGANPSKGDYDAIYNSKYPNLVFCYPNSSYYEIYAYENINGKRKRNRIWP